MTRPQRIQLQRKKGWNLQETSIALNGLQAVKVTRGPGSKWGNPFPVGKEGPLGRIASDNAGAVGFFRAMLDDPELRAACGYPIDLSPLCGHNLACFCRLNEPCHADALIELCNK